LLHIFYGEDDYSISRELAELKKTLGDADALVTNTTVLDGKQVTPEQLRAACETVPFLGEKRLVIIEGLLERFEEKKRSLKKKTAKQQNQPPDYSVMAEAIKHLPPFTELVLISGIVRPANPLLHELSPSAKVKNFPVLKKQQLRQWIDRYLARREKGTGMSPQALNLMIDFVGADLWTMANEIDKLVLYTKGRRIEEADVKAVVSNTQEANIFNMVDAIIESRVGEAQALLQQLFLAGTEPLYVLSMLVRQARMVFQLMDMRDRGCSRSEIQNKLGIRNDFILNKVWAQAERYTPAKIKDVYHQLLEADTAIKTGRYAAPEMALEVLVVELGQHYVVSS
jgi:DNA polymerase-3 subunit delta